ncbi:phosphonate ABC transporter, permease protein PhnE [Pseudohalocynthiibacter aestuariivivens]|jgi:phosphonate transport system permease protein|uniref:Phosphonate ABC transporter, permease protein PhnE n=1 Tax=Pseudohalocynthiibacter aestuariivivens TaxID=1591409 RepID=A0ABV5JGS9_9RHOB|nr:MULTISPECIES: phosphonate ABC transporter, permease protein PhnE [Pseudohalocynthiibacter]MBS9718157.1 phosphonate ABC transporter, permease protein PhnE [Pseudohalocynthiibacter aestuariivivens]MCK0103807.1 phosphonate ABC transporter, permease protein PhnE [Pseudohalocynthiibacter sp. F2068]
MSAALQARVGQRWRKPAFIKRPWLRYTLLIGTFLYLVAAIASIEVNWSRVYEGLDRGVAFIASFTNPDFTSRATDIWEGMIESLIMTVASSVVGILISIPIGLGAARNIAPLPVYVICRGIVAVSRALQEIIVAILLVAIFGFGPLAGFMTLSFATIGFLSKLLAEDIESMDKSQAEAIRATGSRWMQWINYGVQPQFMPRLIGLSMYRLDINFRESTILGLVGAGGIGATLNTAFDRYEFDTAAAILILIIGTVMFLEYVSGLIRARVQ